MILNLQQGYGPVYGSGYPSPLLPTTHTHAGVQIIIHIYDNIRIISTIAFCVLLSSFSSFLAISRFRSLNKKHYDHIILLITYDMQRQKGKAWSILYSITISSKVFDTPSDQILYGASIFWSLAVCKNGASHSIFANCKRSKTGAGEGLGTRLGKAITTIITLQKPYLAIISSPYQSTFLGARFAKF